MSKISDFMDSLNPDTFNCVFSTNGMTLMPEKEYAYRLEEIGKLQQERDKYKSIVEIIRDDLTKGITFCENDSQGHYDICNIAINREKKILAKIIELEEGNSNE